jgi:hypothetical protein
MQKCGKDNYKNRYETQTKFVNDKWDTLFLNFLYFFSITIVNFNSF